MLQPAEIFGASKKTRSSEINTAYDKAIDTYSRVYEIHASDGVIFFPARNRFLGRYYYSEDLGIHNGFRHVEFTGGIELNNRFRVAMNFPYIFGSSRPSEDGVDNVKTINNDLLKTTVEVTIIPFK